MMSVKEFYDEKYERTPQHFGSSPKRLVTLLEGHLGRSSSVLDIGAGQGRNALYIARKNIYRSITAVELSDVGLRGLIAHAGGLPIRTIEGSIADPRVIAQLDTAYDAIMAINVLHFMTDEDIATTISLMHDRINPGGYVAVSAFVKRYSPSGEEIKEKGNRLEPGQLANYFSDFTSLLYGEREGPYMNSPGIKKSAYLLVQKPLN